MLVPPLEDTRSMFVTMNRHKLQRGKKTGFFVSQIEAQPHLRISHELAYDLKELGIYIYAVKNM